jgi:hypothetical protein
MSVDLFEIPPYGRNDRVHCGRNEIPRFARNDETQYAIQQEAEKAAAEKPNGLVVINAAAFSASP